MKAALWFPFPSVRTSDGANRLAPRARDPTIAGLVPAPLVSPRVIQVLSALLLGASLGTAARAQTDTSTPEVFEKVDPYTRGKPELLERAGYVSFGPFQIAQGIETPEVEEVLGGLRVLWVETAHFRLGSLLHAYRRGTDDLEEKKLSDELARLAKRLPRVRKDVRELDPWLRMHLNALRLEEQYADFQARAGVSDADFARRIGSAEKSGPDMGTGPYLGNERKFVVLITEQHAQLQRFARRWIGPTESSWYRANLPGGAWFFGVAAEVSRKMGTPLDSALHGLFASGLAYEMCDGFRGRNRIQPLWLKHGIGLDYARRAEPRWCIYVPRDSLEPDDRTWRWEERLSALVANRFVATWEEMLAWKDGDELEARHHMTAWSRVAWLAETDPAALENLLRQVSEPPAPGGSAVRDDAGDHARALAAAYGKTPAQLDEAWRKWVARKYSRK